MAVHLQIGAADRLARPQAFNARGASISVEPLKEGASHPTEGDLTDGSSGAMSLGLRLYQNVNPWVTL